LWPVSPREFAGTAAAAEATANSAKPFTKDLIPVLPLENPQEPRSKKKKQIWIMVMKTRHMTSML
jgi:hypothetical protein